MTIDRFTDKEFKLALPPNAEYIGIKQSEMCWLVHIDDSVAIMVRSSIDSSGRAAELGKDSIRLWLVDPESHEPRSGKVSKYITRVNGWADRMKSNIDTLYTWYMNSGACPVCDEPKRILIAKKDTNGNKGRPFASCVDRTHKSFVWLDQDGIVKYVTEYPGWNGGSGSVAVEESLSNRVSCNEADAKRIGEESDDDLHVLPESTVSVPNSPSSFLSGAQSTPLEDDPPDQSTQLIQSSPVTTVHSPNAEQLSAIKTPITQPVLVLAGPGTGKTFTLAHRYRYLIEQGVKASEILVVTFGKKAATEMEDRIKLLIPEINDSFALNQICSIHAACFRMLRASGVNYSVPKTWQVKKIAQELLNDIWPDVNSRPGWKEVINFTDNVKDKCYPAGSELERNWYWQTLTSYKQNTDWSGDPDYHVDRLVQFRVRFDSEMSEHLWLRFADMLYLVEYQLTTDADFRIKWQDRYKWIIVDEGQDTSQQAVRILDTLASPQNQMMMVGDIDQLLYRFNGSAPEYNLLSFADRYENTKLVKLVINYRSTQEIVERQVQVIGHNYSELGGPYDQKFVKKLIAHKDKDNDDRIDYTIFADQKEEAENTASLIHDFINNSIPPSDPGEIFILARTRAQLAYIEASMLARKIPFINVAGFSFFNLKHIRDIIAYIQVAINPKNSDAFKRIYNIPSIYFEDRTHQYVPHRWLGKAFLSLTSSRLDHTKSFHTRPAAMAEVSPSRPKDWWRFEKGAQDLIELMYGRIEGDGILGAIENADHEQNPAAVIKFIIDQCYQKYMRHNDGLSNSDSDEGTGKEDDWNTLVDVAMQFDTVLDFVTHAEKLIASGEAKQSENWAGHVIGSTIHRVKGLERDIVFLIGANEGLLPHAFSLKNPPQNGVLPSGGKGRVEDERCCFFVAVSRAREVVYVSGVRQMRGKMLKPSRFVQEMIE